MHCRLSPRISPNTDFTQLRSPFQNHTKTLFNSIIREEGVLKLLEASTLPAYLPTSAGALKNSISGTSRIEPIACIFKKKGDPG
jgi:hypothetical protein